MSGHDYCLHCKCNQPTTKTISPPAEYLREADSPLPNTLNATLAATLLASFHPPATTVTDTTPDSRNPAPPPPFLFPLAPPQARIPTSPPTPQPARRPTTWTSATSTQ
ncbi:uncharacterized protein BO95DRAFT_427316 [Aspergillus brunneoviolaceus CBS 621.78]|uniref:Uncharacterized protein n=1 Tax=Aspergillus brunneoviolaceus CBS 621.78 TaxID=1450534 RepID=A0ACD1GPB3_9EURO|nr:hypothetical protein BO95DRAFT_427316 [Aspergillus brunneoviolaceus CBS 621.78]RAH50958.1 hypothetical protein BO95DRAFT_427316 [Aspergillus brunneoviolaceus CBS 621.78]